MKNLKTNYLLKDIISEKILILKSNNLEENIIFYLLKELFDFVELDFVSEKNISLDNLNLLDYYFNKIIKKNIPVQYLFNRAYFFKNAFYVNKNVLIPRFDSEKMIEHILTYLPENKNIIEIGTGSGALIISLFLNLKNRNNNFEAVDISKKALNVAIKNAKNSKANIHFYKSNLFSKCKNKYDIILANLPYLRKNEINFLLKKEPKIALTDNSSDGLFLIKKLILNLKKYTNENALVFLEHSPGQEQIIYDFIESNKLNYQYQSFTDYKNLIRYTVIKCGF